MIVGVAIQHEGKIHRMLKPYRHIDIICYLRENALDRGLNIKGGKFQGFYLDDKDRTYLDREQAMSHAKIHGQVSSGLSHKYTLFSEDLW